MLTVMSARPSVCPHVTVRLRWMHFYEILYLSVFRYCAVKTEVSS